MSSGPENEQNNSCQSAYTHDRALAANVLFEVHPKGGGAQHSVAQYPGTSSKWKRLRILPHCQTLLLNLMQRTYVDQLYFLALEKAEAGAQILQLLCLDKRPFMVDTESLGTGDTLQQLYQNKSVLKVRLQICDLPGGCFLVPAQRSIDVPHKGSLLQQLPVLVHPLRHFGFWRSFQ